MSFGKTLNVILKFLRELAIALPTLSRQTLNVNKKVDFIYFFKSHNCSLIFYVSEVLVEHRTRESSLQPDAPTTRPTLQCLIRSA